MSDGLMKFFLKKKKGCCWEVWIKTILSYVLRHTGDDILKKNCVKTPWSIIWKIKCEKVNQSFPKL